MYIPLFLFFKTSSSEPFNLCFRKKSNEPCFCNTFKINLLSNDMSVVALFGFNLVFIGLFLAFFGLKLVFFGSKFVIAALKLVFFGLELVVFLFEVDGVCKTWEAADVEEVEIKAASFQGVKLIWIPLPSIGMLPIT